MRKAAILFKDEVTGVLTQHDDGSFTFRYHDEWFLNSNKPQISLTLSKTQQKFDSKYLFPFFYNMLPEGSNRQTICKFNRIDLNDYFGLLMISAKDDNIGAVKIIKIEHP